MTGEDILEILSTVFSIALALVFLYFVLYVVLYKNIEYVHRRKNGSFIHFILAVLFSGVYFIYRIVDTKREERLLKSYTNDTKFEDLYPSLRTKRDL